MNAQQGGTAAAVLLILLTLSSAAAAHDFWISDHRNSAGEWCCGASDCAAVEGAVAGGLGWSVPMRLEDGTIYGTEFVPYSEAAPSPDGQLWICRRPDRSRRCVFGPPPNT